MINTLFPDFANINLGTLALSSLLSAVLTFILCAVAIHFLMRFVERALLNAKWLDQTLTGFIVSVAKVLMWLVAVSIICDELGIPSSSLVALVSVVGLALSLSVQGIMSNLFSGLTILITRPFVAGDYVEVASKAGTVKRVGLFYTTMDTVDNTVISIPNSDITGSSITNYSTEPLRRVDMHFCASYDDSTEAVRRAIAEAIDEDKRILREPEPFIAISEYKDSSIEYLVRVWCKTADYWPVHFALNESVRESFERNGVRMSYAHVNVHILDKSY